MADDGALRIDQLPDARVLLERCESLLVSRESENCLLLGLADAMARRTRPFNAPLLYVVCRGDVPVGAALRTDRERPLSVSCMPLEAAARLVDQVPAGLAGCVGDGPVATAFADRYAIRHGVLADLYFDQIVYEVTTLRRPPTRGATLVQIQEEHRAIVERFFRGFMEDVFPEEVDGAPIAQNVQRHLENGTVYLLLSADQTVVATAASSRETRNTASIGFVYTPPEHRKNGYGALVTALVTERRLAEGKKACNLFADAANPTSNSIYQKIGYREVGRARHFRFLPSSGA